MPYPNSAVNKVIIGREAIEKNVTILSNEKEEE